jgi:hypothetical protein
VSQRFVAACLNLGQNALSKCVERNTLIVDMLEMFGRAFDRVDLRLYRGIGDTQRLHVRMRLLYSQ